MVENIQSLTWMVIAVILAEFSTCAILNRNCQCVPDQWQGILASVDREFDLTGGRSGSRESYLYITYDYVNKKFAMTDLKTGNRAVADYNKGFKYVIRKDNSCKGIQTSEEMRRMCLPDHAEHMGEFRLGTDVPVDLWKFTGPFNVSMKTTVIQKNCVPITEEVYMAKGTFASLTSSMYLDVDIGIQDEKVFNLPSNCHIDISRHENTVLPQKRADGTWSLIHMLKNTDHY